MTQDLRELLQEVAACFTRDDDLPDDLLPRIDAALAAQPAHSEAVAYVDTELLRRMQQDGHVRGLAVTPRIYADNGIDDTTGMTALYVAPPAQAEQYAKRCNWYQEDEDGDYYATGCGQGFAMNEDSAPPSWLSFCCHCGKPVTVHPWEKPTDEDDAMQEGTRA